MNRVQYTAKWHDELIFLNLAFIAFWKRALHIYIYILFFLYYLLITIQFIFGFSERYQLSYGAGIHSLLLYGINMKKNPYFSESRKDYSLKQSVESAQRWMKTTQGKREAAMCQGDWMIKCAGQTDLCQWTWVWIFISHSNISYATRALPRDSWLNFGRQLRGQCWFCDFPRSNRHLRDTSARDSWCPFLPG